MADDTALEKYRAGEKASSAPERKEAFNEALRLYLQMESDTPSALLCYNIANCYYQLNEYGLSILYYNKALKIDPRLEVAKTNLQIAEAKVGLPKQSSSMLESYLLFFHYKLTHNEKAITSLLLLFLAFALLSVHLWMPQPSLRSLAIIALWIALILFSSIIWSGYLSSPEAICIRPVALRRDAGDQYAAVVGTPILVGTKLQVLSIQDDGNWLKVRSPIGEEGYISKEYARII